MKKGEKKIYDGMTVNVKIITENKNNIVLVPTTALQSFGTGSALQVMKWPQQFVLVPVELWITDGKNSEILTWVQAGDRILLKKYTVAGTAVKEEYGPDRTKAQDIRQSTRNLGVWGWGGMRPSEGGF